MAAYSSHARLNVGGLGPIVPGAGGGVNNPTQTKPQAPQASNSLQDMLSKVMGQIGGSGPFKPTQTPKPPARPGTTNTGPFKPGTGAGGNVQLPDGSYGHSGPFIPTQGTGGGQRAGGAGTVPGQPASGPGGVNIQSQENPQLAALLEQYKQYSGDLSKNSDLEATQAMQRQRDAMSGMAKEFGGEASARGIGGTGVAQQDLYNKIINPGEEKLSSLNADLASDARKRQLDVMNGQGNVAGAQANYGLGSQQLGLDAYKSDRALDLDQWKTQQQSNLAQAQLQQAQQNNSVNQMLALLGTLGGFYSGF